MKPARPEPKRLAILISGRGSNMAAILAAVRTGEIAAKVAGVISNRPAAPGLSIAGDEGVPTIVVDHAAFADRAAFERELAAAIDALEPDLIVLAGFMRVLGADFVARYAGRLLNIHPSLLPAYPGLHTHRRALADGVKVHGCTVHFVTHDVDHGPIVAQAAVAVREDDDEASLAARVLAAEHRILVAAVRWFCADRLAIDGGRVRVDNETAGLETLLVPAQS
ncbi:MAG TPA: phosphoribosylglycinamide formyltransferase [Casimicrobiaceae bacterium]|nr:phosphoribosylglycinamide formyltransferase [Casimicrobiaceae bacterium]